MDLSIIIVNWNTCDLLVQCLESIYQGTQNLDFEVIVVDNASVDDSVAVLRACFPRVQIIENGQNVGFAKANNEGLRVSQGQYAVLLNSDTIVLPGALTEMIHFAVAQPKAGIIGCKLLNPDGSAQTSWASFPTFWSEIMGRNFRSRRLMSEAPLAYEVDWVGGACLLACAEAIQQVGGLDERYFMYSEETDWCFRMKQQGWGVYYLAEAEVMHLGGGSAQRSSLTQLVYLYESKSIFFNKHYGLHQARLLRYGLALVNGIGLLRRLLIWPFHPQKRGDIQDRLATQWGLICYLLQGQPSRLASGGAYADRH